jgi:hypothetical protein
MPLYVTCVLEQAAYRRFARTHRATQAHTQQLVASFVDQAVQAPAAAPAGDALQQDGNAAESPAASGMRAIPQQQQQQQGLQRQAISLWHRVSSPLDYAGSFPQQLQLPQQLSTALEQDAQEGSLLNRMTMHLLLLVALLLLCWCTALLGAELLWRQLTAEQLLYLCPSGPRIPFLIAGQVYHG